MKYLLLLTLLTLSSCAEPQPIVVPQKEKDIAWQYSQLEYRSEVVKWKVKQAEIQVKYDQGTIERTAADLERRKTILRESHL